MKKVLFVILLFAIANHSYGQVVISGILKRTDSSVVKLDSVFVRPDTGNLFQQRHTVTDTNGSYSIQLPSLPAGFRVITFARDCNNNFVYDTVTYTGGQTMTSNLVVCIAPTFKITGYVHLGSAAKRPPQGEGKVYLIEKCAGDVLAYIDSTSTDTNGFYSFDPYPTLNSGCSLLMRAALVRNAADYSKFLPAYHLTNTSYGLRWSTTTEVTQAMGNDGVNLLLPEAINLTGGPSEISGYAVDAATNNPLQGYIMFITDMNDVTVAYTHTDMTGKFSFTNIPFGTYKVFGDAWGKSNPDLIVKVHADEVNVTDILFTENQFEYKGWRYTGIEDNVQGANLLVYPNPVKDQLTITNIPVSENGAQVKVYAMDGQLVQYVSNIRKEEYVLPTTQLSKGVYIVEVTFGESSKVIKVIK